MMLAAFKFSFIMLKREILICVNNFILVRRNVSFSLVWPSCVESPLNLANRSNHFLLQIKLGVPSSTRIGKLFWWFLYVTQGMIPDAYFAMIYFPSQVIWMRNTGWGYKLSCWIFILHWWNGIVQMCQTRVDPLLDANEMNCFTPWKVHKWERERLRVLRWYIWLNLLWRSFGICYGTRDTKFFSSLSLFAWLPLVYVSANWARIRACRSSGLPRVSFCCIGYDYDEYDQNDVVGNANITEWLRNFRWKYIKALCNRIYLTAINCISWNQMIFSSSIGACNGWIFFECHIQRFCLITLAQLRRSHDHLGTWSYEKRKQNWSNLVKKNKKFAWCRFCLAISFLEPPTGLFWEYEKRNQVIVAYQSQAM